MNENFDNKDIDLTNVPEANQAEFIQKVESAEEAREYAAKAQKVMDHGRKTAIRGGAMMAAGGFVPGVGPAVQVTGIGFAAVGAYEHYKGKGALKEETERLENALDASRAQVPLESVSIKAARAEMERTQEQIDTKDIEQARSELNVAFETPK